MTNEKTIKKPNEASSKADMRTQRTAQALRDNLRRRKLQTSKQSASKKDDG